MRVDRHTIRNRGDYNISLTFYTRTDNSKFGNDLLNMISTMHSELSTDSADKDNVCKILPDIIKRNTDKDILFSLRYVSIDTGLMGIGITLTEKNSIDMINIFNNLIDFKFFKGYRHIAFAIAQFLYLVYIGGESYGLYMNTAKDVYIEDEYNPTYTTNDYPIKHALICAQFEIDIKWLINSNVDRTIIPVFTYIFNFNTGYKNFDTTNIKTLIDSYFSSWIFGYIFKYNILNISDHHYIEDITNILKIVLLDSGYLDEDEYHFKNLYHRSLCDLIDNVRKETGRTKVTSFICQCKVQQTSFAYSNISIKMI